MLIDLRSSEEYFVITSYSIHYTKLYEIQLQQRKKEAYLSSLDTIASVFGEETKIGKAALIAKQAFAIAETVINIAKGTGETAASVPFPFNIPLIIGYAAQVATLVATIKGASKNVSGYATGGYTNGDRIYRAGEAGQEWIAPHWMLSDADTSSTIQQLENKRLHPKSPVSVNYKSIPLIDAEKVRQAINQTKDINENVPSRASDTDMQLLSKITAVLENTESAVRGLNLELKNGIKATATINKYGRASIDEAVRDIDAFNKRVSRQSKKL